jgi:hypothetical protein
MMFYVLLLPRIFLTPPVASAIPILDDKPSSYRSKCCKCSGPLWPNSEIGGRNREARFNPESRLNSDIAPCLKSAMKRNARSAPGSAG